MNGFKDYMVKNSSKHADTHWSDVLTHTFPLKPPFQLSVLSLWLNSQDNPEKTGSHINTSFLSEFLEGGFFWSGIQLQSITEVDWIDLIGSPGAIHRILTGNLQREGMNHCK